MLRQKKVLNTLKTSDFWSIIISFLALFISVISYFDVHNQMVLTAGQVKAYVQVTEARLTEPIASASFIKISTKIKNLGQTAATNVYGEMDYKIGTPDFTRGGNSATRRSFGSLGPGLERIFVLSSNRINRRDWPEPDSKSFGRTIYFFGTVWYTDDTSKEKRKEDWCYELTLKKKQDLESLDLEQSTNLIYKSGE